MTVSLIGTASVAATSITLPSHSAGDLIVAAAWRSSTADITAPSGWSILHDGKNFSTQTMYLYYMIAESAAESLGVVADAEILAAHVWRDSDNYIYPGAASNSGANSRFPNYAAFIRSYHLRGTSLVAGFCCSRSNIGDLGSNAPSGWTSQTQTTNANGELASHTKDVAASVLESNSTIATLDVAAAYQSCGYEILDTGILKSGGGGLMKIGQGGGYNG